jgi:hypothetical protein
LRPSDPPDQAHALRAGVVSVTNADAKQLPIAVDHLVGHIVVDRLRQSVVSLSLPVEHPVLEPANVVRKQHGAMADQRGVARRGQLAKRVLPVDLSGIVE